METVSVIVPIFKVEAFLEECLKSIISQSYEVIQILLIDDGSPDTCSMICDYNLEVDSRISVVHSRNKGLSVARNIGISLAKGKFVYFVDSDDFLELNAIETLYYEAEKNALDIVLYDAVSFDESSTVQSKESIEKYIRPKCYSCICSGAELFERMVQNDEYRSPVQYTFIRRDLMIRNGLLFHEGIIHEDEEFTFFALLYARNVKHINNILYHHRFRAGSIMNSSASNRNTDSVFEIIKKSIYEREHFMTSKQNTSAFIVGVIRFVSIYYYYVGILEQKNKSDFKKQIKELKEITRKVNYLKSKQLRNEVLHRGKKSKTLKLLKRIKNKVMHIL